MKVIGYLIAACVPMALLRLAAATIALAVVLALIIGCCTRPRETFGLLAFLFLTSMIDRHPAAFLGTIACLSLVAIVRR